MLPQQHNPCSECCLYSIIYWFDSIFILCPAHALTQLHPLLKLQFCSGPAWVALELPSLLRMPPWLCVLLGLQFDPLPCSLSNSALALSPSSSQLKPCMGRYLPPCPTTGATQIQHCAWGPPLPQQPCKVPSSLLELWQPQADAVGLHIWGQQGLTARQFNRAEVRWGPSPVQ